MKRNIFLTASILLLTITGIFSSCKKNNDKKANCRIIGISSPTTPGKNTFSYDANGKPTRLVAGGQLTIYNYAGNTTTVTSLDSGKFLSKTMVVINDAGLAINVRTENNEAGTDWTNGFYEYNGDELMKSTTTSSVGGKAVVTSYTWKDHNMVSTISDTTTTTFGYYTDKSKQNGDYFSLVQTIQGYEIIRNKNLLKSVATSTLAYEFGSDGNISSLSATTGSSTTFLDFEYQCN